MPDSLFQGLPPPSVQQIYQQEEQVSKTIASDVKDFSAVQAPAMKGALKRPKSSRIDAYGAEGSSPTPASVHKSIMKRPKSPEYVAQAAVSEKRCRFKTIADASETQIIEAIQKISFHIKCLGKFSKASKLAVQLIQSGSVNSGRSDCFFAILEAAMSLPISCTDVSVRADFHALFSESQELIEFLNYEQRNQLATWTLRAVVANDLFTDDSFVFSRATCRIKEAISSLPIVTKDDDMKDEEAVAPNVVVAEGGEDEGISNTEESDGDPFGLNTIIPNNNNVSRKDPKAKCKKNISPKKEEREEESAKRFLKSQRETLALCVEIAASRYKTPWCQTGIDILAKHAFDNIERFGREQRSVIRKVWSCLAEQQIRRKQGRCERSEVNGFEWLQQKYGAQKISIRHSVGNSTRRAEQWLG